MFNESVAYHKKTTNENSDKLGLLIYLWYDFNIWYQQIPEAKVPISSVQNWKKLDWCILEISYR